MREATEGDSFDAILEDEFRGIENVIAQKLYLTVCCFYQHGAYLRDALMAELMDIPLVQLFDEVKDALEGVVFYDLIDEDEGSYVARARHRIIAEIVWNRCGEAGDREDILQRALSSLNLNYKSDNDAFEYFVRSDQTVDAIRSLDEKIRFFEVACRKDPTSPYVQQHFARMLTRAEKPELALSQIERAIKLVLLGRSSYLL